MADLLVIRVNVSLKSKEMSDIKRYISACRKNDGVIVLPPYCEALIVPDDAEVKVVTAEEMKGEQK